MKPLTRTPYIACWLILAVGVGIPLHLNGDVFIGDLLGRTDRPAWLCALVVVGLVVGTIITARRLLDLELSPCWSCLVLVPYVNVVFVLVLCLFTTRNLRESVDELFSKSKLPHQLRREAPTARADPEAASSTGLGRFLPGDQLQAWWLAVALSLLQGFAYLGLLWNYHAGWGTGSFVVLFLVLALFAGGTSALVLGYHRCVSATGCFSPVFAAFLLTGVMVWLFIPLDDPLAVRWWVYGELILPVFLWPVLAPVHVAGGALLVFPGTLSVIGSEFVLRRLRIRHQSPDLG